MPEGPLGFPRLTTLGPLVERSSIEPFKDISEGKYSTYDLKEIQPRTGQDTIEALGDIIEFDLDNQSMTSRDVMFSYRREQISEVLEVNDFSSGLLEAMSKAEQNDIPLKGSIGADGMQVYNDELENEVRDHMDGDPDTMFTDDLLSSIDLHWQWIIDGSLSQYMSEAETREEIVGKVISDFNRVMEINEAIRDSREYFPPTVENIELGAPAKWGTIDGAHRIVTLSQILGTDEEILIWEWDNEEEFI